ncbi:MAG TPA: hypothetical protein VJN70_06570, partial [Gemmatimonadaceae bacterium]|nr:hypothetical protein [Gemmatimonadaceae bacterium]
KVALSVRAGELVLGSVLRTPQGIKMTARLLEASSGAQRAAASAEGRASSYPALVDTIANELLAQQAGEQKHLYLLQHLPTSAVSAYVEGKRNYRAGKYDEAVTLFERALDSSRVAGGESRFGFAALALMAASNYEQLRTETAERGLRIAWAVRDDFNLGDRAFLDASAGPTYPRVSTRLSQLQAWDHALNVLHDDPEAYYQFGDQLFQVGKSVQWEDAIGLARKSLEEAVRRDSTFIPAVQKLAELDLVTGNLSQAEQLLRRLPDGDTATDRAGFLEWRLAVARGDERKLADLRRRLPTLSQKSAREIWLSTQLEGIEIDDARRALDALRERATRREDRATVAAGEYLQAMNGGRPREALGALRRSIPEDEPYFTPVIDAQIIRDAIFAGGDGAAAVEAVNRMSGMLVDAAANDAPTHIDLAAEYVQRCALEEWRLAHGNTDSWAATVRRLRAIVPTILPDRIGGTNTAVVGAEPVCPVAIEAWAATMLHQPDARRLVDQLDTTMAHGPQDVDSPIGNLLVARLRLAQGDTASALHAVQRRQYDLDALIYLGVALREEGRLAAALGDRQTAIRAYTHYLALRSAPEPSLQPEAAGVRAALGALQVIAQDTGRVRHSPRRSDASR